MRKTQYMKFSEVAVNQLFMFGNAMWIKVGVRLARLSANTDCVPFEPDTVVEA